MEEPLEYNIDGLSDTRLLCVFMKCCEMIYYYKALKEEGKEVDANEVRRWMDNIEVTRAEIIERGLLDDAFNLN